MTGSTPGTDREKVREDWRTQWFTEREKEPHRERQRNWGQMVCGILTLLVG